MALYEYSRTRGYTPYRRGTNYVNEYNRWRKERLRDEAALQDAYRSEEEPRVIEVHTRTRRRHRRKHKSHLLLWFIGICLLVLALVFLNLSLIIAENFATISTPNFTQSNAITNYTIAREQSIREEGSRIEGSDLSSIIDPKVYEALMSNFQGISDEKAKGMSLCYNAMQTAGFTPWQSIGLVACAYKEGQPGLVQYSYPSAAAISQAGTGNIIKTSSGADPFYIDSKEKAEAMLKTIPYAGNIGIGSAQWTAGRATVYCQRMLDYFGDKSLYTKDDLAAFEHNMYVQDFENQYSYMLENIESHSGTFEDMVAYTFAHYEAGGGYYDQLKAYGYDPSDYNDWLTCGTVLSANGQKDYTAAIHRNGQGLKSRLEVARSLEQILGGIT